MWSYMRPAKSADEAKNVSVDDAVAGLTSGVSDEEKQQTVATGFLPKAVKFASKMPFARDLAAGYYCMTDGNTPSTIKGAILIPLLYFVVPVDAIPDFIPAAGFSDDVAVWLAAFKAFGSYIKEDHYASADDLFVTDQ